MRKKLGQALMAMLLAAALLLGCAPVALAAPEATASPSETLQIGLISDLHYFSKEQAGGYNEAFMRSEGGFGKLFLQSEGILDSALAALAAHAKQNGMKYVLIPGDLTREGELAGHKALAARLERFEKESGLQVAVIGGNHDINNDNGADYASGVRKGAEMTSPQAFREVYKNLGFDLPNAAYYTPPKGETQGMLSYAVDLGPGYRLVVLDAHRYDIKYNGLPKPGYYTGSVIPEGLMDWALEQCHQAVKDGKTVLGMSHYNLTSHIGAQEWIFQDFVIDDWLRARERLAGAGMRFFFSGHIHQGEMGEGVNDDGEVIYDICTSSLTQYPCTFREVRFTSRGKNDVTAQVKTLEVDCVKPVTANGVTYKSPFSKTSFGLSYDERGVRDYVCNLLRELVGKAFEDIQAAGGISKYLKAGGTDLESTLNGMLKGVPLVGGRNAMGLVGDIFKQVEKHYVSQPERTLGLLDGFVDKLLGIKVSSLPSTQFINSYGLGNKNKAGTLADLGNEAIIYIYGRVGGAEKNRFVMDAIAGFESGKTTDVLVDTLLDALLNDLLEGELLPTLEFNLAPVFSSAVLRLTLGALLDGLLRLAVMGDNSFQGVVDLVFKLIDIFNIAPFTSLDDAVDTLLEEYWTPSQSEGIGHYIGTVLRRMVIDQNDVPDNDATLRYTGPRKVTPTQEDFRLPSMVTQMLPTANDGYDRAIGWFTKYSVKGTDIRVWDSAGKDVTANLNIKKNTDAMERFFPGVDLGIAGFITAPVQLVRHTVEVTGLEPLRAYTYQVGDASRGWWSPKGLIKMPLNGNQDTTFLSFSDMQSQTPLQYARAWGKLSSKALALYPDALFVIGAGDNVDNAANLHQWTWFLDSAQNTLRQLPLMSATGNHENKGDALRQWLPFGGVPAQDNETGTYYSFDIQNLHFTVLNTNDLDGNNRLSARQVLWLKRDIKTSKADWKVVVLHKALYSNGSHIGDKDVAALRAQLTPLFAQLGVDAVIGGHDHVYLRTEVRGVQYVIAGTSGVKYYNAKSAEETDALLPLKEKKTVEAMGPVFSAWQAKGGTLTYKAYLMDEKTGALKEIDSFELKKNIK